MIQAHRDHVLAKERAIRQEAKAKEEAATKLQALRRGQVGRRNSIQLAEMKALANPKPKILTKLEEEAEEDAVIEELWGAIDERRSRLDDQRLQVTNMEDGEEKEAALAELAALARAVKEDEAMIQSLDMGEGSPPGTPARLIPGDDEESLKKRSRLENEVEVQNARCVPPPRPRAAAHGCSSHGQVPEGALHGLRRLRRGPGVRDLRLPE